MTTIEKLEVQEKHVELRSTFKTALREVSEFPIVQVIMNESALGEAVGTPAITGETFEQIYADCASVDFEGLEVTDNFYRAHIKPLKISQGAKAALDMAVRSLQQVKRQGLRVATDVTIPIADISDYPTLFRDRANFHSFKIKLGNEPLDVLITKMESAHSLAPGASLRVDPNQSWSQELAIAFLRALEEKEISLDYLEQPCPKGDFDSFKKIKSATGASLMADESCFTESDLIHLIEGGGVDYINLKILKSGGASEVLHLAKIAQSAGLRVSIGSMMESELGVREAISLAAEIEPDFIHDLDAGWWLKESTLKYENGEVIAG